MVAKEDGCMDAHRVTMREVATQAGVSIKTVSNVLNDYEHVKPQTREKVMQVIASTGYKVNASARNLRRGRTGLIALAVPDLAMPYFAQLSSLVITEAKKLDLSVVVEPTLYSREGELSVLHGFYSSMIDGLLYSPLELGQEDVEKLKVKYPMVLLGERIFTDSLDHIATENVEGAKKATEYLISTGCTKIAIVGTHPGEKIGSAALRFEGYKQALAEAGIAFDPQLEVPMKMWHRIDGEVAMDSLLKRGIVPDAVVAGNDLLASGVEHSIQVHGLRVPEDISVIGFDNSEESRYLSPALTTISPGLKEVARLAVETLNDRIEGREPAHVGQSGHVFHKVASQLVVRGSTRRENR